MYLSMNQQAYVISWYSDTHYSRNGIFNVYSEAEFWWMFCDRAAGTIKNACNFLHFYPVSWYLKKKDKGGFYFRPVLSVCTVGPEMLWLESTEDDLSLVKAVVAWNGLC